MPTLLQARLDLHGKKAESDPIAMSPGSCLQGLANEDVHNCIASAGSTAHAVAFAGLLDDSSCARYLQVCLCVRVQERYLPPVGLLDMEGSQRRVQGRRMNYTDRCTDKQTQRKRAVAGRYVRRQYTAPRP